MNTKSSLVVIGNGPCLELDTFSRIGGHDSIGMNGAYRYFQRVQWWPTYFCCFDWVVTRSHAASWQEMIDDPAVPIQRYFLLEKITDSEKLTVVSLHGKYPVFSREFASFGNGGNTGVNACQIGVCLGYTKLIVVGIDAQYQEFIPEAAQVGRKLKIVAQPQANPNYFFPDYQQVGDEYNVPKAASFHQPAWSAFARFARGHGIDVVNCSPKSKLGCFRRSTLEIELGAT